MINQLFSTKINSNFTLFTLMLATTLGLLSGCSESFLSVHTDYMSHENLASFHVGTPDPLLNNPPIGQRIIIGWSFPKHYLAYADLHLELTIRLRNREEVIRHIPLTEKRGTYVYALLNDEYIQKRGILTYKVDLIGNNNIIEAWRHQIWTDLIVIEHDDDTIPLQADETPFEAHDDVDDEHFE